MDTTTLYYIPADIKEICAQLNQTYTKDSLVRIIDLTIKPFFNDNNIVLLTADGKPTSLTACRIAMPRHTYAAPKNDLLRIVALALSSANIRQWFQALPAGWKKLLERLTCDIYVPRRLADLWTGNKSETRARLRYGPGDYPWCEPCTLYDDGTYEYTFYLALPDGMHKFFRPILDDERLEAEDFSAPSQRVIDLEAETPGLLASMMSYYEQGIINYSDRKPITASGIRIFSKLGGSEFPTPDSKCKDMRIKMLAHVAALLQNFSSRQIGRDTPTYDAIKILFGNLRLFGYDLLPVLTEHVKGVTATKRKESNSFAAFHGFLAAYLKQCGSEWTHVDTITDTAGFFMADQADLLMGVSASYKPGSALVNKMTQQLITADQLVRQVGMPMLKAMLLLYASMGIVKFSYTPPEELADPLSPYDCIEAVCPTALGRYVLGLEDSYTQPEIERKPAFEASSTALIVRVLDEDTPFMHVLETLAKPIGNNRWIVTAATLLDGCETQRDVQHKTELFRHYIDANPPAVWENFFNTVAENCRPLEKLPLSSKYRLYSVNPANSALVDILTGDPTVRQLIIRAENHLVLVPTDNHDKLVKRLKELGYLLQG